jgi:hypothetical protein
MTMGESQERTTDYNKKDVYKYTRQITSTDTETKPHSLECLINIAVKQPDLIEFVIEDLFTVIKHRNKGWRELLEVIGIASETITSTPIDNNIITITEVIQQEENHTATAWGFETLVNTNNIGHTNTVFPVEACTCIKNTSIKHASLCFSYLQQLAYNHTRKLLSHDEYVYKLLECESELKTVEATIVLSIISAKQPGKTQIDNIVTVIRKNLTKSNIDVVGKAMKAAGIITTPRPDLWKTFEQPIIENLTANDEYIQYMAGKAVINVCMYHPNALSDKENTYLILKSLNEEFNYNQQQPEKWDAVTNNLAK